ncbi:DUF3445 domain-containing protein [Roseibium sp. MMSF_3544]|uniref:heme-dependent oxidative N-demethylase family protein n=1 Tax=unclassified Roseibium TaxID=2629323 RepID=UPI0027401490|nr:DUF3445 domain-containing protein [Roseibium sp. MMSF_3544]
MTQAAPPFLHRPYDGTSQPFTVGLRPIGEEIWLEPDTLHGRHLEVKERLFADSLDSVFRAEDNTQASQLEVLELVVEHLRRLHGNTHEFKTGRVRLIETGREISLEEPPPLLTASRLVQEDLVIMRPGPDGYRLVAASLCFPSSWRLSEKFGLSMTGIHEGVPGFNGGRMGQVVARLFENLKAEQLLCRFNWSIYPDENLHHPLPERIPFKVSGETFARLFLRVERQTLRRLPQSGDILFTIKIHHDPLEVLSAQEDKSEIASGLRAQLLELDADQLRYKGLVKARDEIAATLARI